MRRLAIHSVPRSGSTWLGSIFDSHPNVAYRFQPLFSFAFKSRLNQDSSLAEIISFFHDVEESSDDFITQREAKEKGIIPTFSKDVVKVIAYKEVRYHHILRNLLKTDSELRVIGLVRNPLSTLHSWLNAPKEFRRDLGWNFEEEWRFAPKKNRHLPEEFNGYEKWKEIALMFEELKSIYPDRFYLLKYDDLLSNTEDLVSELFHFCGLDLDMQCKNFLKESRVIHMKDAYGVFKKRTIDHDYIGKLPAHITTSVTNDLAGSALNKYLL